MGHPAPRLPLALEEPFEGRLSSKSDLLMPERAAATPKAAAPTQGPGLPADAAIAPSPPPQEPGIAISEPSSLSAPPSSGVLGGPEDPQATSDPAAEPAFDGLLVSWQPGSSAADRAQTRRALGLGLRETIHTPAMQRSGAGVMELIDLPPGLSADQAISRLSRRGGVLYAEKNWILAAQATSNDPYMTNGSLWGMGGNFGSNAAAAWAAGHTGSKSVYVGVIDEGYQIDHPDLIGNIAVNPGEIAGNGVDDDGNGLVDDVHGWDFDGNNNTVYDGTADDHGTHVAGTIGATGGNGTGVVGVNWNVSLLNAKFLGRRGGSIANAIKAVDYFTDLKIRHNLNIVATNNSWGGGGFSQGLQDAIGRANNANILFIAAAGNSSANNDSTASYPSNYPNPNVIAVASITSGGSLSSFSSYGATTVDLGAPGSGIWSTVPDGTYSSYNGTSMATPHVTGAAALLSSIHPGATAAQIKQALIEGTVAISSLSGRTASGGRLDIPKAIQRLGELITGGATGGGGGGTPPLPAISISAPDASAAEAGPNPGTFRLTRSGGDLGASLTVNLIWRGTATNGTDYELQASSVMFAANQTTADLQLNPLDDTSFEGSEAIILEIQANSAYTISGPASATVSLADNDPDPNPPAYDPITNFQRSVNLFDGSRQKFLDGSFNTGFGLASYATTTSTQDFDPNSGSDVIRVLARDAGGQPYSWFFSSKYSLNGVNGLAVFADLGTPTNLGSGRPDAQDDLVAFLAGWTYRGQTFLGTPGQVNWIQVVEPTL